MKKLLILTLWVSLLFIITGCTAEKGHEAKGKGTDEAKGVPKEVRIGYQVIPNAELLAKEQGLLEKKFPDTKIKWLAFDSGRDVNTAFASGTIDLGLAGSVPLATGIANNLPYKVFFIHDVIGEAESLVVRKDSGIKDIKDFVGKKVAVPFGSTAHFSLLMALDKAGVDLKKLSILDLQPQDILAAWERKDIDAAFIWNPSLSKILEKDGVILTSAEKLAEEGIMTSDIGAVHNKFAEKYPGFIKEYVKILDDSVAQYRNDPEEVAKILAPALGVTSEDTKKQMKGLIWIDSTEQKTVKYLGKKGAPGQFANVLEETGQFLKNQEIIQVTPDKATYQSAIYHIEE